MKQVKPVTHYNVNAYQILILILISLSLLISITSRYDSGEIHTSQMSAHNDETMSTTIQDIFIKEEIVESTMEQSSNGKLYLNQNQVRKNSFNICFFRKSLIFPTWGVKFLNTAQHD